MRNRMYSAELGRFLQTDPIGYQGGMNLYAYVLNDPVNLTDPLGLKEKFEKPLIVVVGGRLTKLSRSDFTFFFRIFSGGGANDGALDAQDHWEYSVYERDSSGSVAASAAVFDDQENRSLGFFCASNGLLIAIVTRGDNRDPLIVGEHGRTIVRLTFDNEIIRESGWFPGRGGSVIQENFDEVVELMSLSRAHNRVSIQISYSEGESIHFEFSLQDADGPIELMTETCLMP